jgi:hypothetical protein
MKHWWDRLIAWLTGAPRCSLCGHSSRDGVAIYSMADGHFQLCLDEMACKARALASLRVRV